MSVFMKNFQFGALMLFSFILLSCSSDDDSSGIGGNNLGSVEITLSGDLEGNRSGIADFSYLDLGAIQQWELNFNDYNPQTFDLNLMIMSVDEDLSTSPQTGTYEIGFEATNSSVFFGSFTNIENQDFANAVEYDTFTSEGGVLIIETSNSERVTGSFSFTAHARDDDFNEVGEVHVSGTFSANKRLML